MTGLDLVALIAESAHENAPVLGRTEHALVPVHMAPPALVQPLRSFADHPFDTNVFGITRFPDAKAGTADPVGRALAVVKEVCFKSGLEFHLASDTRSSTTCGPTSQRTCGPAATASPCSKIGSTAA